MKIFTTLSLMIILLSACPKVSQDSYNLGETIMVPMNQSVQINSEDISILLTKVQEGRCPKGTNCIQAGEAKLSFDFRVSDAVSVIDLTTKGLCEDEKGSCGSSKMAQGYTVKLYYLYPYPSRKNKMDKKYVAKIMITKAKDF